MSHAQHLRTGGAGQGLTRIHAVFHRTEGISRSAEKSFDSPWGGAYTPPPRRRAERKNLRRRAV
jgi:hypothetical protein